MTYAVWPIEREELLRKLWVQEVHINDILVLLNRIQPYEPVPTTKAIQRKAERMKLSRRPGRTRKLLPKLISEFSEIEKNAVDKKDIGEDYIVTKIVEMQNRVKRLLLSNKDPFDISVEYKVPLREVYRMAAELRQQQKLRTTNEHEQDDVHGGIDQSVCTA